jgi:hypothetical protein
MPTQKLRELKDLAAQYASLSRKEQTAARRKMARSWEVLEEETEVKKILMNIFEKMRIRAQQGIQYFDVMSLTTGEISSGWNRDLYEDEVPLEAVKSPVARKVYLRLLQMGLRPRIISDPKQEGTGGSMFEFWKIVVSW